MKKLLFLILIAFIYADEIYTVRSGDTLTKIAAKYGVTVDDLVAWNNISNKNNIYVGQKIVIKTGGSSQEPQPQPSGSYIVTDSQMRRMGWTNYNLDDLNNCLKKFDITTKARIRHFIAQTSQNSKLGEHTKELGGKCSQYDGRRDLGNTQPGDGCRYRGAGYLQMTGRINYQKFADYIGDSKVMEGYSYVASKYPWTSAGFWWYNNGMNKLCDNGASVETITKKVAGGTNKLSERKKYYDKACSIF